MHRDAVKPVSGSPDLSYRHKVRHASTLRVRIVIDRCRSKQYDRDVSKFFTETEENSDLWLLR